MKNKVRLSAAWIAWIVIILSSPGILRGAETESDSANLADVLGTQTADWKITPAPVFTGEQGRVTMVAAGDQILTLESVATQPAPAEVVATIRLRPLAVGYPYSAAYARVQMACGDMPDKTPQLFDFMVSAPAAQHYVQYSVSIQGPKTPPPAVIGYLYLQAVTERSLAWPEELRAAIDAQIAAAPKLEEMLGTLRCTVEGDRFRCWFNGRFCGELAVGPDLNTSGKVRLTVQAGAELVSLRVRPLAPVPRRFEPLPIAGNLNSDLLAGEKVDRASLPAGPVDGVPFEFPQPTASGDDHIDVGQSWTRFGALPGYIGANMGLFGGRWISADRIDPARICMYVPQGRYKALHLIAIADDREDSVPTVSAQFYRPNAGHPFNFAVEVPNRKGGPNAKPVAIKYANGKSGKLYHVAMPLDADAFSWFTDLPRIGLEITKRVQYYRAYPDPLEYSWHGAGLPSSVQIYAMTLERAAVDVDLQPDQFGHFWTAPAAPAYTLQLRNLTAAATTAKVTIATKSHDGLDTTTQEQSISLPADMTPVKVPITLKPTRYGLQELTMTCTTGDETTTWRRNFAYLHPDTRDHDIWESGRGSIFGFWAPGGNHDTPPLDKELPLMAAAGAETSLADYTHTTPEIRALAAKYHFINESAFYAGMYYANAFVSPPELVAAYDPKKPEESGKALVEYMRKYKSEPSALCRPIYLPFYPEPLIGPLTAGVWPSYYGMDDFKLPPEDQKTFDSHLQKFLIGARAVRKEWPEVKILLPYGDPMYTAIFMRLSPEARQYIDGIAVDMPGFERLPEQQIHQVDFQRMYACMKDVRQYNPDPYLVMVEGISISSLDIDTGQEEQADIGIRDFLLLIGYGVTRFESSDAPFDCANYWGENHYGGGWCTRKPVAMPKLAYVAYATLTRHINRANFVQYLPTGSTSAYCQQYKHYRTGKLIHVLWTIRGQRIVNVKVAPGTTLEIYDEHDNATPLKEKDGMVTFTVDQSPKYLEGLTADAQIALGASDHSDAKVAEESAKLGNLGDGSWRLVAKEDEEYAHNKPLWIERFLGDMTALAVAAPKEQGTKALAIHLGKQSKDRGVMPFCTTLEPKKPIAIEGKASHLGLWVHAASDWGRVVYVVRDEKGEKWVSVGAKEDWNNDDIHCWSSFCFDGWRYLRFQLPANAPYDSFRERGTSWWGSYGGDGIVDLPLKLEKIIVERRPKVIYANDLVEAKPDDVLLGDLYAEYASAADRGSEAVRLSRLRMPLPTGAPVLANPIADQTKTGTAPATKVLKVSDPAHQYDGTRCHVHFEAVAGAISYDVWVSPYPDGRGAMKLGAGWKESGGLIAGLRPDTDFYAFVVYADKDGKQSKPSPPLKFALKDRFVYK
jgi:hypothetical protein